MIETGDPANHFLQTETLRLLIYAGRFFPAVPGGVIFLRKRL